jgi:hypothetical protein
VDSDLAEAIKALKASFDTLGLGPVFGSAREELVTELTHSLKLPKRYRQFLLACDPVDAETITPSERIRLIPSSELLAEQEGFALNDSGTVITQPGPGGWRPSWIIVGRSSLLGDPYFLDTTKADAEGDCPVYSAMSGTDIWQPRLAASSFALFIRILATAMEVAQGFDVDDYDVDNEQVFRESLGPRIREFDPAALKAGHWT